ncbi:NADPH-dependent oxidoreductase [Limosilactobacillus equigenerosi]|uniref:Nitroreductase n=1 Tax=Limosilactobacillus equigenerosi DSM 18793 = JCM 14505 TaxID=1423742 RepID=A0A0R1ULB4_9LACO|nr:Nitroreductase [Limosilactobacillus equigenerosi DSM 18793 = JCM 14505]
MNETIQTQLNHRSIRAFKDQALTPEQLNTLYDVARHTSTSMFLQQMTILHLTDPVKRAAVREIGGQPYIGANGDLLIFVADLHRNQLIRHRAGNDDGRLHTLDVFLQAYEDATLAVQNVLTATESMGLGGVILGSINDDPKALIKALNLPPMTFPVLGLQIGVPDQSPQLKPRLPKEWMAFENDYPTDLDWDVMASYDQVVNTYYDLRNANQRIDTFTDQINGAKIATQPLLRDEIIEVLHAQGLALDLELQ